MTHKLLIVDDHPIFCEGLANLVGQEPHLVVCGHAADAASALQLFEDLKPELVLVDLSLATGRGGLQLVKMLRARDKALRILVVSMHDELLYAEKALQAGANGYINKVVASRDVLQAVNSVLQGKLYLSPRMSEHLLQKRYAHPHSGQGAQAQPDEVLLSMREIEVFELIGKGMSTREIAERLCISHKTVDAHKEHIKKKLGISNNSALIQRAVAWDIAESII